MFQTKMEKDDAETNAQAIRKGRQMLEADHQSSQLTRNGRNEIMPNYKLV